MSGAKSDAADLPSVTFHLRISPSLAEYLRIHAFHRAVSLTRLLGDILTVWTVVATPSPEVDPRFRPDLVGVAPPPLPTEPHPNYLHSLGYDPEAGR